MRTSVAARSTRVDQTRPTWWLPTVGTLVLTLVALVTGLALSGPAPSSEPPTVSTPFSRVASTAPVVRVASFNVLGANHTDGARANKKSFAKSTVRTPATVQILNNNGVDIVGFQELNRVQHDQFMGLTKGAWDMYPGDELTHYATHNSIAWRTAKWQLVEANTIPITYFNGTRVPMPFLLMRHKASGRLLWVANFHNPASTRHRAPQLKWRTMAKNDEVALANRLHQTGLPLVITGDMNERESYHCAMTSRAPMKAANGGSFGTTRCVAPRDTRIDWIFGSSFLRLSNYLAQRTPLVRRATDHPVILSDVAIPLRERRR